MPNDAERRNLYPERMNECSILNTKLHSLLNQTSTRHLVCSVLYRIEEKIYRPEKKIYYLFSWCLWQTLKSRHLLAMRKIIIVKLSISLNDFYDPKYNFGLRRPRRSDMRSFSSVWSCRSVKCKHKLYPRCLKITEKVSFNVTRKASYVYIWVYKS